MYVSRVCMCKRQLDRGYPSKLEKRAAIEIWEPDNIEVGPYARRISINSPLSTPSEATRLWVRHTPSTERTPLPLACQCHERRREQSLGIQFTFPICMPSRLLTPHSLGSFHSD